jgi:hypothetical protein
VNRPGFTLPIFFGTLLAMTSEQGNGQRLDLQYEKRIKAASSGRANSTARVFSDVGDAGFGALVLGTTYLAGRWSGEDRLAEASSLSAEAVLSAGLWSSVLKTLSGRTRPGGSSNGDFFVRNPEAGQEVGSFPSGHATGAFAVATVFSGVYRDHRWVPWVSYGTAGMIGLSRVALGRHFPSDVIVGSVLGNSFGKMVLARREGALPSSQSLRPLFDPRRNSAGVAWSCSW